MKRTALMVLTAGLASGAEAQTLSSVVYSVRDRCLYFHEGTPCLGTWKRFAL